MKRLPLFLIFSSAILLSVLLPATADDTNLLKSVSEDSPKRYILDNGLVVVLKEIPLSGLVSIEAKVRAGSIYEGEFAGSGISHFVEHMIFKGTPKRGPGQIERDIRALGGTINGGTAYDYTTFAITIPKEDLFYALEVLSDSLFNADMHPDEMEKERSVILKEIRLNRDDPARYISQLLWASVFKIHPYRHPIIGYENIFIKLKRDDLLKYHRKLYIPNNMVLVVVGDIEIDKTLKDVKSHFQKIERAPLEERALPQERPQTSKRVLEEERDVAMAYFALGYPSVDIHHPDMPALDLLSAILGEGKSSRFNSVLYRKKGLVYSIGAWNYTPLDPGIFIISGVTDPEKLRPALGVISEEVNNIKKDVDDEELSRVKSMIIADYLYSLQDLSRQASDLATSEILTGDFDFTKKYLERIGSVTKDDVIRVAKTYLNDDSLSLITLSPSIKKSQGKTKRIVEERIERFTLQNGLRVLLRQDHRHPIVSMVAVSLGGLRAETEKNCGISNLTGLMMLKGTTNRSEEEISRLAEDMGADLSFFSGNNTLGIRFELLSKDLDKGLELFQDIILNPSFPDDILERERTSLMAAVKATDDDIFNKGMEVFKKTLFMTHPYRFQTIGTIESIKNLKREDVEEFYKNYFVPNNMVLAIFGDIDSQRLREKVDEYFSQLKKGPEPKFTTIIEQEQRNVRQDLIPIKKQQTLIIMGFKGATIKDKDRYTLQLISTALSGISGRLSSILRERLGIAYAVGSDSVPAYDPGYFILYAATTRDNIPLAKKVFLRQIKILNKKGLAPEELDVAKKELIGNQLIFLQNNNSLAYQCALDEIYGLGYDSYLKFPNIINSITQKDIVDASRRYLKPKAFTLIIIEGRIGE